MDYGPVQLYLSVATRTQHVLSWPFPTWGGEVLSSPYKWPQPPFRAPLVLHSQDQDILPLVGPSWKCKVDLS